MATGWRFIHQQSETDYCCVICGCEMSGRKCAQDHFNGRCHADAVKKYGDDISPSNGNKQYYCRLCDCRISGYVNVEVHLTGEQHQKCLYGSDTESSEDESEHWVALSSRDFIISYTDCHLFYCCLCHCEISHEYYIRSHLWGQEHKAAVKIYGSDILGNGNYSYYCRLCKCPISSFKNIYDHVKGQRHDNFLYQ